MKAGLGIGEMIPVKGFNPLLDWPVRVTQFNDRFHRFRRLKAVNNA